MGYWIDSSVAAMSSWHTFCWFQQRAKGHTCNTSTARGLFNDVLQRKFSIASLLHYWKRIYEIPWHSLHEGIWRWAGHFQYKQFFPLINFRRGIAVGAVEKQAHREPRQREGGGPTGNGQERPFSGRVQLASSETTPFLSCCRKHRSVEGRLSATIHLHCTDAWLTFKWENFSSWDQFSPSAMPWPPTGPCLVGTAEMLHN